MELKKGNVLYVNYNHFFGFQMYRFVNSITKVINGSLKRIVLKGESAPRVFIFSLTIMLVKCIKNECPSFFQIDKFTGQLYDRLVFSLYLSRYKFGMEVVGDDLVASAQWRSEQDKTSSRLICVVGHSTSTFRFARIDL